MYIFQFAKIPCPTLWQFLVFGALDCMARNVATQLERCSNPNHNSGFCISVYDCPSVIDVISRNQLSISQRQFLAKSQCQNDAGREPHVCCTSDKDYTNANIPGTTISRTPNVSDEVSRYPTQTNGLGNVLPEPPQCGPNSLADKIYNGKDTALDEYPWMVLLEYDERNGRRTINCGGSLINQRYVLTAAHCVKGDIEQTVGRLASVRLGEYNISSEIDCIGDDCNNKAVELDYEEVLPHPQFNPRSENRQNDIALIRLNADVTYTDFIKPVCLPVEKSRQAINPGESLIVSGWGRTLLGMKLLLPWTISTQCSRVCTDTILAHNTDHTDSEPANRAQSNTTD